MFKASKGKYYCSLDHTETKMLESHSLSLLRSAGEAHCVAPILKQNLSYTYIFIDIYIYMKGGYS